MNRIHDYAFSNPEADDTPQTAAVLDLAHIVSIKTPSSEGDGRVILVHTTAGKGLVLPYNAEAVKQLTEAWRAYVEA